MIIRPWSTASILGVRTTTRQSRLNPEMRFESKSIGLTGETIQPILTGIDLLTAVFLGFRS
jgi:hypothetical protein